MQKLPSTLYKKVVDEHRLYCVRNNIAVPEEKIELHQQIASSPVLTKHIDSGTCPYAIFLLSPLIDCFLSSPSANHCTTSIHPKRERNFHCWSGEDNSICSREATEVAEGWKIIRRHFRLQTHIDISFTYITLSLCLVKYLYPFPLPQFLWKYHSISRFVFRLTGD